MMALNYLERAVSIIVVAKDDIFENENGFRSNAIDHACIRRGSHKLVSLSWNERSEKRKQVQKNLIVHCRPTSNTHCRKLTVRVVKSWSCRSASSSAWVRLNLSLWALSSLWDLLSSGFPASFSAQSLRNNFLRASGLSNTICTGPIFSWFFKANQKTT